MSLRFLFLAVVLSAALFSTKTSAQSVSSFQPSFERPGANVAIFGAGFVQNKTAVLFNNVPSLNVFLAGPGQLNAVVPATATTGPITIRVTNSVGQTTTFITSSNFFVVRSAPFIFTFSPTNGGPGTVVSLRGMNLSGVTNVTFGGVKGTFVTTTSDSQIDVQVPAAARTGKITLTRTNLNGTSLDDFFVPPVITGFSPSKGRVGTNVTIRGRNFQGVTQIRFGSLVTTSFTPSGGTQVVVAVPAGASTGTLMVTAVHGASVTTSNFVIEPTITGFSPVGGRTGTNVTITGFNLTGGTTVSFNGVPAAISSQNPTQLIVTTPGGITTGPITVTTTNGSTTTTSNFFAGPTITSFSPGSGTPGTEVIVTGGQFTNVTNVRFNGTPAASFVVNSLTQLRAIVPAGATSGRISVLTPGGTAVSASDFTVSAQTDVAIALTSSATSTYAGSPLTYTVVVTNKGPAASVVTVTNSFSWLVGISAVTTSQGSFSTNNGRVVATLGNLLPGSKATVTMSITPSVEGSLTNFATLTSTVADLNTANNFAEIVVTVLPAPRVSIRRLPDNNLRLAWPVALSNLLLETSLALGTNAAWGTATPPPVSDGVEWTVPTSPTGEKRFYRLRKP